MSDWEVIGTVDVDSGMLLVINPCRIDESYHFDGERMTREKGVSPKFGSVHRA